MTLRCPPDVFQKLVTLTGIGPLSAVTVEGTVDFSGARHVKPIRFSKITFDGAFRATHADFEGSLVFDQCLFKNGIDLEGTRVDGSVHFSNCQFGMPNRAADKAGNTSIWLDHATITGDLRVDDCTLEGALSASAMTVTNDAVFASVSVLTSANAPAEAMALNLKNARIDGTLELDAQSQSSNQAQFQNAIDPKRRSHSTYNGGVAAIGLVLKGDLNCGSSRIQGDLDLSVAKLRSAFLTGTQIKGRLAANFIQCTLIFRTSGSYRFDPGENKWEVFEPTAISGDLSLNGAIISGQLDLGNVRIGGAVVFNGSNCGSFLCGAGPDGGMTCSGIYGVDSTFSSYVHFVKLTVSSVAAPPTTPTGEVDNTSAFRGIEFRSCTFASGLEFWRSSFIEDAIEADGTSTSRRKVIGFTDDCRNVIMDGSLSIIDCKVTGQLDLTRLHLTAWNRADAFGDDGTIIIDRTTVSGKLLFCSPESYEKLRIVPAQARKNAASLSKSPSRTHWQPALAKSLHIAGLVADDVDLTGLRLSAGIDAERVVVAGTFKTYEVLDGTAGSGPNACWAEIPRALKLGRARIGELIVSKNSFGNSAGDPSGEGIVLGRAQLGHLRMPWLADADNRNGFPVPLDLDGAQIETWSFSMSDKPEAERINDSERYLDVLDNDFRLHRPIYRAVYRQLRDSGDNRAALRVFVAESYRAFWASRDGWTPGTGRLRFGIVRPDLSARRRRVMLNPKNWWAAFWSTGNLFYLRYGASLWRLAVTILLLAGLSLWLVARDVRNFEVTQNTRQSLGIPPQSSGLAYCDDGITLGPDPTGWNIREAVWITLRYHIPLINLVVRSEFRPTHSRPLVFLFGARERLMCTSPPNATAGEPGDLRGTSTQSLSWQVRWLNADDWFNFMSLLNWILWPLLLTFVVRRLVRD